MKFQLFFFFFIIDFIRLETETKQEKVQRGKELSKQAFYSVLFGDGHGRGYADLFFDTNYSLLEYLDTMDSNITLDEYLRLFIQSLIILIAKGRHDLITADFPSKHFIIYNYIHISRFTFSQYSLFVI